MTKGAKIALGCAAAGCLAVVVVGGLIVAGVGAGAYWVKGKAETLVAEQERIQKQVDQANAENPFDRPSDGVIQEARLLKFLEIRKRVFVVYEKHRAAIEGMEKQKDADFAALGSLMGIFNEARQAQANALAEVGMSQHEYAFLVESIYKSAWAAAVTGETGRQATEAADAAIDEVQRQLRESAARAKEHGIEGAEAAIDEAMRQAREAEGSIAEAGRSLEVPPQNVELFNKHKDQIAKYAMGGFEMIGL
jgi:hypothetical protein